MNYKNILITGGAGFVGSNLSVMMKEHFSGISLYALDNLVRKGSELNMARLSKYGVTFVHGDVRNPEDLDIDHPVDLIIECSAEPSVLAGVTSSPEYIVRTNLVGAVNCFELARRKQADVVFLSTSRVYPVSLLNAIVTVETDTRFEIAQNQSLIGVSARGISEKFPLEGRRTLYGATKLAAELLLAEYAENYGIRTIINRCGVIAGPWQMGKVDQGIATHWMASHMFGKKLSYFGFNGTGKQVRDMLHIDDLFSLLTIQLKQIDVHNGIIFNVGGGSDNAISLTELTDLCHTITKRKVSVASSSESRPGDVKIYVTDNNKIENATGWKPSKKIHDILDDIHTWIAHNRKDLSLLFAP